MQSVFLWQLCALNSMVGHYIKFIKFCPTTIINIIPYSSYLSLFNKVISLWPYRKLKLFMVNELLQLLDLDFATLYTWICSICSVAYFTSFLTLDFLKLLTQYWIFSVIMDDNWISTSCGLVLVRHRCTRHIDAHNSLQGRSFSRQSWVQLTQTHIHN